MKKYDALFIGWGKAGKTLAKQQFAISGKKVAIVEKTKEMAGRTCIDITCIATKVLVVQEKECIHSMKQWNKEKQLLKN